MIYRNVGLLPYVGCIDARRRVAHASSKCPDWKRANVERHKLFERPKPELTEAQKTLAKKRQELARVIERLRSSPLTQGIARELKKQQAILELEIAELETKA